MFTAEILCLSHLSSQSPSGLGSPSRPVHWMLGTRLSPEQACTLFSSHSRLTVTQVTRQRVWAPFSPLFLDNSFYTCYNYYISLSLCSLWKSQGHLTLPASGLPAGVFQPCTLLFHTKHCYADSEGLYISFGLTLLMEPA